MEKTIKRFIDNENYHSLQPNDDFFSQKGGKIFVACACGCAPFSWAHVAPSTCRLFYILSMQVEQVATWFAAAL